MHTPNGCGSSKRRSRLERPVRLPSPAPVGHNPRMPITTIAFDGDDTLWANEDLFQEIEEQFHAMLLSRHDRERIKSLLLATERRNLELFGYGAKGFTLSMIETALELAGEELSSAEVSQILQWGKELIDARRHPLDGAAETVAALAGDYELLLITKGDLVEQRRKVQASGLTDHFAAVEILAEKDAFHYRQILDRRGVHPTSFAMVGNSLRSDVLPVVELGGFGVHVPYHVTWAHETVELPPGLPRSRYRRLDRLADLPALLAELSI
jgi:putative hydrolase of the HAD superfamily